MRSGVFRSNTQLLELFLEEFAQQPAVRPALVFADGRFLLGAPQNEILTNLAKFLVRLQQEALDLGQTGRRQRTGTSAPDVL